MDILLKGVCKSYDDSGRKRVIFRDLSTGFRRSEFYTIMGKSGVGKSSLLNMISGIDVPDSGSISIDGKNIAEMSDGERTRFRRRHIGFIYQFFNLIPVLSVIENVTLVAELDGVSKDVFLARAEGLLKRAGLYERRDEYPDRLSGGEQQRVAVVRALVNHPGIILADEPTGNLDSETGTEILGMISDLARQCGSTLIMVTHSPEAAGYADHFLRVEGSTLVNGSEGM